MCGSAIETFSTMGLLAVARPRSPRRRSINVHSSGVIIVNVIFILNLDQIYFYFLSARPSRAWFPRPSSCLWLLPRAPIIVGNTIRERERPKLCPHLAIQFWRHNTKRHAPGNPVARFACLCSAAVKCLVGAMKRFGLVVGWRVLMDDPIVKAGVRPNRVVRRQWR